MSVGGGGPTNIIVPRAYEDFKNGPGCICE